MPSTAYKEYAQNLIDVHRLLIAHRKASAARPGKRGLGHFTRGGLVLLCAAWERYAESALEESAKFLISKLSSINDLPARAKKKTVDYANSGKGSYGAADIYKPIWGNIFLEAIKPRIDALNTPKHKELKILFETFLDISDIAAAWSQGSAPIDDFVKLRGEVAHRGRESKYIWIGQLENAEILVSRYVAETDNFLSDHMRKLVTPQRRPWNRLGNS